MGWFATGHNGKDQHPEAVDDLQLAALRDSYLDMVRLPAWKHLKESMEEIKNSPVKILDQVVLSEITLSHAGFIKGIRAGIVSLEKKVDYILNGIAVKK